MGCTTSRQDGDSTAIKSSVESSQSQIDAALSLSSTTRILKLTINDGSVILNKVQHKGHAYCIATIGSKAFKTNQASFKVNHETSQETLLWKTGLAVLLDASQLASTGIELGVYDPSHIGHDDYIGRAVISSVGSIEGIEAGDKEMSIELTRVEAGETRAIGTIHVHLGVYSAQKVELNFWSHMVNCFGQSSGSLDLVELQMMMEGLGMAVSNQEVEKQFKQADKNGDGRVSVDELYEYFKGRALSIAVERAGRWVESNHRGSKEADRQALEARILWQLVISSNEQKEADSFVTSGFLTEANATRGFTGRLLDKFAYGDYKINENNGNIFVKTRGPQGALVEEQISSAARIGIRALYQTDLKLDTNQVVVKILTKLTLIEGKKMDDPSSASKIQDFVDYFQIDMSEYIDPVEKYTTFNEFFYRKLKPSARPIAQPENPKVMVSAADSRCSVWPTFDQATKIWIKGSGFTLAGLLHDSKLAEDYTDCSLVIFRLAPQDYHRFHHPADGKIVYMSSEPIPGCYYTVNPMCVRSNLPVYSENKRHVTLIETAEFGRLAYVSVGATLVGSIMFTKSVGQEVKKGDEHGYFAFGGSTVILLIPKGKITFDDDLIHNSQEPIETLLKMGEQIGTAN